VRTYASFTRNTSEPIKRLAHGRRFSQIVSRIASPLPGDTVLDYGCGDAHLFAHFLDHPRLVGYEPNPFILDQASREVADAAFLTTDVQALLEKYRGGCSLIFCTEVCEHLTDEALETAFNNIKLLAAPQARIVFGVPVETGLSGLLKLAYRMSMDSRRVGQTLPNAVAAAFGQKIDRMLAGPGYYAHHTGFDHSRFRSVLERSGFRIQRTRCLPIWFAGTAINNEVYFICQAPDQSRDAANASNPAGHGEGNVAKRDG
jgi:SAM-dependent methyltransferase